MEGVPEGTGGGRVRRPASVRLLVVLGAVFAVYLLFRLGQGVLWLAGHL